jgi:hypothetical protein
MHYTFLDYVSISFILHRYILWVSQIVAKSLFVSHYTQSSRCRCSDELCAKSSFHKAHTKRFEKDPARASSTSRFSLSGQSISRAHRIAQRIHTHTPVCASLFRHTYLSVAHTSPTQRQVSSIVRDLGCSAHISCKSYAKEAKNLILSRPSLKSVCMCVCETHSAPTRIHNGMIILFTPHTSTSALQKG